LERFFSSTELFRNTIARICATNLTWGTGNEEDYLRFYFDRLHDFYSGLAERSNIGLTGTDYDWSFFPEFWESIDIAFPNNKCTIWLNLNRDGHWHYKLPNNYEFIQLAVHTHGHGQRILSSYAICHFRGILHTNYLNLC
jgi:hypothetical protein